LKESELWIILVTKYIPNGPNIRAEICHEYRGYIIKYFVNCCEKEGIIYSLIAEFIYVTQKKVNRLCGLVVRVPGYRSRGPGLIPSAIRFSEK
jgi:hypothetical protein